MRTPKVTVLMPVFNGEKYIRESIDSILNQTFTDFEFLIICAPSNDNSLAIIESYADKRIRLVETVEKRGLIADLNQGLELAKGEYIARMDCDDISLSNRLEKQVSFMENNPDVGVCGSWIQLIGENEGHIEKYPTEYQDVKANLLFYCAIAHPTVIMRRSLINEYNLKYNQQHMYAEDFGLWKMCSYLFPIVNIPEVLLKYRNWGESASKRFAEPQMHTLRKLAEESLATLGLKPNESLIQLFIGDEKTEDFFLSALDQFNEIQVANNKTQIFDKKSLSKAISRHWLILCYNSTHLGIWILKKYYGASLKPYDQVSLIFYIKFFIKSLIKYNYQKMKNK